MSGLPVVESALVDGQGSAPNGGASGWASRGLRRHRHWVGWLLAAWGVTAGIVALPLGPDVSGEDFERSFRAVVEREAPPSNHASGIVSLECPRHSIWNNANRTCKLEQEISLLPDASAVYDVDVYNDGCWIARLKEDDSDNEAQLIGTELRGCVKREPKP